MSHIESDAYEYLVVIQDEVKYRSPSLKRAKVVKKMARMLGSKTVRIMGYHRMVQS